MARFRPYILPIALVLGLLLHSWASYATPLIPYVIFSILLLNFSAVDLKSLKFNRLDGVIMAFQTLVSLGGYLAIRALTHDEVLAQGCLIVVMCPVAAAVVVVSSALGADRRTTTGYTVYGNLLVAVIAPIYFSFIGTSQDMPLIESAWLIFKKIASVIALPFFVALLLQAFLPKLKSSVSRLKEWALPLWAFALLVTLGQTIDFIFKYHEGNMRNIIILALIAILLCAVQFGLGKLIGKRYGEKIAGGQLMGQKNVAMGIWMASIYLMPLSTVALAFYSISQNVFNSWQMWKAGRS